jgi:hypothetical protein
MTTHNIKMMMKKTRNQNAEGVLSEGIEILDTEADAWVG